MLRITLTATWLALLFVLAASYATALDVPDLKGRVMDGADLLTASQEATLSARLAQHESETSNQVVVVTVSSLQGQSIEAFALALGRHWGIGQAGRNNGVILLVAPRERKVRIEVGYGLEGDLPDALAKSIIDREILPSFRQNLFDRGILRGSDAILAAIEGSFVAEAKAMARDVGPFLFVGAFLLLTILGGFYILYGTYRTFSRVPPGLYRDGVTSNSPAHLSGHGASLGSLGGGFGGGGGFSGGGGSFGGGGASGGW